MTEPNLGEPWAFIAHKKGCLGGVAAANLTEKELREFLGDFAGRGYAILTVHSRDEYSAALMALAASPSPGSPAQSKTSNEDALAKTEGGV
jgi:hypothetical protein